MPINTTLTVFCDVDGCSCWKYLEAVRKRSAAKEARKRGWVYRRGTGWVCPGCAAGLASGHAYRFLGCDSSN